VDTFIVAVERVEAPDVIAPDAPLPIAVHGVIGPDLCYAFHSFRTERTPARIDLTVLGVHRKDEVCAQAISELRGETFEAPPPFADSVLVVVHLPDGNALEHRVRVEPR
jgi:hypothetical protein